MRPGEAGSGEGAGQGGRQSQADLTTEEQVQVLPAGTRAPLQEMGSLSRLRAVPVIAWPPRSGPIQGKALRGRGGARDARPHVARERALGTGAGATLARAQTSPARPGPAFLPAGPSALPSRLEALGPRSREAAVSPGALEPLRRGPTTPHLGRFSLGSEAPLTR